MWMDLRNDTFFVISLYVVLELESSIFFQTSAIWNPRVTSKASFFSSEACWKMVLTHEKFQRRGWLLVVGCWLLDAFYIKSKKKLLVTFSFTVSRQWSFNSCFFLCLAFLGCYILH